jgi:S1-C subfamily serine protease
VRTRIAALLAAVLLLGGLIAGCGGGDDDSISTVTEETGDTGSGQPIPKGSAFNAQAVFDRAAPGVVTITSIFGTGGDEENPLNALGPQGGQGSGFVISDDGEIVTNAHVITDAQAVVDGEGGGGGDVNAADEVYVEFPDRNSVEAEIIGFDLFADIALIKVDPDGLDLQPVELGNIDDVEVGEQVAAIGSPFGETQSLSVGFVSQLDRSIPSLSSFTIDGAIQTDASINPGNSGGPLLDSEGRVIGVNQQIDTTSGGNQGVGFAVPIDLVERSVEDLRDDGESGYGFVGVQTVALFPQLAEELDAGTETGLLVQEITPDSPAEEAGIEAGGQEIDFQFIPSICVGGDIIVSVDGEKITSEIDLPRSVALKEPGEELTLGIIRDGEEEELDVTLAERPVNINAGDAPAPEPCA